MLLVLALLGLLSTVLIVGTNRALTEKPSSPQDIFWGAVQQARKLALTSERDVTMQYVDDKDKGKAFVITNGETTKQFPIPSAGDLEVTFLSQQKGSSLIMVAGTVLETQKLGAVTFYADGTCTAFKIQFFKNGAASITSIDQWTCAPMLTPPDPNAPAAKS